jgi:ATP-dependent DNA helicase RecQ
VLKGETNVMLREQAVRPSRVKRGKQTVGREAIGGVAAPESALLRALRAWRLGIAREHGVPAFVVFHDSTLETIAALRPGTRDALRGVSGVGEKKLERYGEALLEVVRSNSV